MTGLLQVACVEAVIGKIFHLMEELHYAAATWVPPYLDLILKIMALHTYVVPLSRPRYIKVIVYIA